MANFKSYQYNHFDHYHHPGTFTWTKPSDIDESKPILVHVWGAGGNGAASENNSVCHGGGGGGLAVKLINVSSLGATETITVGAHSSAGVENARGGTSSFGSHCSATGGNDGYNNTANEGSAATYGVGGLGLQGDVNRRGGTGGVGYYASSSNAGGGGGGSAPAPYGVSDGFAGGNGTTYAGGGGGGIGGAGNACGYRGGNAGSSMAAPERTQSPSTVSSWTGAPGLAIAGDTQAYMYVGYTSYGGGTGKGAIGPNRQATWLTPNEILIGGKGGIGGSGYIWSSSRQITPPSNGGPGGGGGGCGRQDNTTVIRQAGLGGILGGGGGGCHYANAGWGGLAAGGGGFGYSWSGGGEKPTGGDGWVIVQYARLV